MADFLNNQEEIVDMEEVDPEGVQEMMQPFIIRQGKYVNEWRKY